MKTEKRCSEGRLVARAGSPLFAPAAMVIHAGAKHALLPGDVFGRWQTAAGAIEAAEIDAQIFRLGRPVAGQRDFDAAAERPAGIGGRAAGKARRGGTDIADGKTAGGIRHDPVERVAGAAAYRGGTGMVGGAE